MDWLKLECISITNYMQFVCLGIQFFFLMWSAKIFREEMRRKYENAKYERLELPYEILQEKLCYVLTQMHAICSEIRENKDNLRMIRAEMRADMNLIRPEIEEIKNQLKVMND